MLEPAPHCISTLSVTTAPARVLLGEFWRFSGLCKYIFTKASDAITRARVFVPGSCETFHNQSDS